jgi:hypothetical protein
MAGSIRPRRKLNLSGPSDLVGVFRRVRPRDYPYTALRAISPDPGVAEGYAVISLGTGP